MKALRAFTAKIYQTFNKVRKATLDVKNCSKIAVVGLSR